MNLAPQKKHTWTSVDLASFDTSKLSISSTVSGNRHKFDILYDGCLFMLDCDMKTNPPIMFLKSWGVNRDKEWTGDKYDDNKPLNSYSMRILFENSEREITNEQNDSNRIKYQRKLLHVLRSIEDCIKQYLQENPDIRAFSGSTYNVAKLVKNSTTIGERGFPIVDLDKPPMIKVKVTVEKDANQNPTDKIDLDKCFFGKIGNGSFEKLSREKHNVEEELNIGMSVIPTFFIYISVINNNIYLSTRAKKIIYYPRPSIQGSEISMEDVERYSNYTEE